MAVVSKTKKVTTKKTSALRKPQAAKPLPKGSRTPETPASARRPKGVAKKGTGGWDINDLREAKYNPRFITDSRLKDLGDSYATFGDLSGVVFNAHKKSRNLISGHQRLKAVAGWNTVVNTKAQKDKQGTVELGYIEATCPDTKVVVRIPLRIVEWSDKKAEFAANIAANAHGGDFDNKKLALLVEKLDKNHDQFPINVIGLDPMEVRGLRQKLQAQSVDAGDLDRQGTKTGVNNGAGGSFSEYKETDFDEELNCTCPRCSFRFGVSK